MSDIVPYEERTAMLRPAVSVKDIIDTYQALAKLVNEAMHDGHDFGVIPGTNKPTLLKPGADKLCKFSNLILGDPPYEIVESITDWTGVDHAGEPFFYFHIRVKLYRDGRYVGGGDGSCNSWEKKYRYRQGERVCPKCGAAAIIKGKAEYGGGWLCFGKRGGCGAKFKDNDTDITGQDVGQVPNPDIFDQVNTMLKMAFKRAYIGGVITTIGASEFFTQDMEDIIDAQWTEHAPMQYAAAESAHTLDWQPEPYEAPKKNGAPPRPWDTDTLKRLLQNKAQKYCAEDESMREVPPANDGKRGAMNGKVGAMFGKDDDKRREFFRLMFGVTSTMAMNKADIQATLDWIAADADLAVQEAMGVLNTGAQDENDLFGEQDAA